MVTLVEWEVSIPAVPVVISSTLSTVAVARVLKMTLLMETLFVYYLKNFENQTWVRILEQG